MLLSSICKNNFVNGVFSRGKRGGGFNCYFFKLEHLNKNLSFSDLPWRSRFNSLREKIRWSCGAGLVFMLGIARVELNYCFPIAAQNTDRWDDVTLNDLRPTRFDEKMTRWCVMQYIEFIIHLKHGNVILKLGEEYRKSKDNETRRHNVLYWNKTLKKNFWKVWLIVTTHDGVARYRINKFPLQFVENGKN